VTRTIPIVPAAPAGAPTQTVWLYEKQAKIYPRAVSGRFAQARWWLVALTQLVFYGLPWLQWNGRQAVLFDLASRRFYIGGLVLYPQDFIYLTVLLLVSAFGLFLFTAVAGRVWCGYACPHTVYTEMFLAIERWFEGDRQRRQKLDAAPWSFTKFWRKGGKHAAWVALALWTGLSFVGYFTPIRELGAELLALLSFGASQPRPGLSAWEWFWVLFYGFATWGNAGFMREQFCKYMCPYARFQSAMFDRDTLVVAYDPARGEPRGPRRRNVAAEKVGQGDCIDCTLCVQVCPTGIDIREGLQMECIGCAACIDVCDSVMDKMGSPRGLVRYATQNAIAGGWDKTRIWRRIARPRVLVYSAVMLAIVIPFVASLALRVPFKVDVVRDRGALARQVGEGAIENSYRLQIMNATEAPQRYRVGVEGLPSAALASADTIEIGPAQARWMPISLRLAAEAAAAAGAGAHPIRFNVTALTGGDAVVEKSTFVIPR
jgi:cytochrome c oxidase accessory protein FixG